MLLDSYHNTRVQMLIDLSLECIPVQVIEPDHRESQGNQICPEDPLIARTDGALARGINRLLTSNVVNWIQDRFCTRPSCVHTFIIALHKSDRRMVQTTLFLFLITRASFPLHYFSFFDSLRATASFPFPTFIPLVFAFTLLILLPALLFVAR